MRSLIALVLATAAANAGNAFEAGDVGPKPVEGGADGDQGFADVAVADGAGVVVWLDGRDNASLWARGVDAAGVPATAPTKLAAAVSSQPSIVACGAGRLLVAFKDAQGLAALWLDGAGHALGPPLRVSADKTWLRPALACDEKGALVSWVDDKQTSILAARVGTSAVDKAVILATDDNPIAPWIALTSAGSKTTLAWIAGAKLRVARVDAGLRIAGKPVALPLQFQGQPLFAMAASAHGVLVAADVEEHVRVVRLDDDLRVIDASPLTLGGAPRALNAAVAGEGDRYRVAYVSCETRACANGARGETVVDVVIPAKGDLRAPPTPRTLSDPARNAEAPRLAPGVAVFSVGAAVSFGFPTSHAGIDVWSRPLDGRPAHLVTTGPAAHSSPAVTSTASGYLVAWIDDVGTPEAVRAARVSFDGKLLDEEGFPISPAGSPSGSPSSDSVGVSPAKAVAVASSPSISVVAWVANGVMLARVDEKKPSASAPTLVAKAADDVAVAYDGEAFLVAFSDRERVLVARVDERGALVTQPLELDAHAAFQGSVSVACVSGACLVSWSAGNNGGAAAARIVRGDTETIRQRPRLLAVGAGSLSPHLVAADSRYVLAWQQSDYERDRFAVGAREVSWLGEPEHDLLPRFVAAERALQPAMAWDGARVVVAWSNTARFPGVPGHSTGALSWAYAGEAPRELAPHATQPALASSPNGGVLAGYIDDERRLRLRLIAPDARPPRPATQAAPGPAPFHLAHVVDSVRAAVKTKARTVTPAILLDVNSVVVRTQNTARAGKLPVAWSKVSSTTGTSKTNAGRVDVRDRLVTASASAFGNVERSVLFIDGDVRAGSFRSSLVIATGDVDVAWLDDSIIIAAGAVTMTGPTFLQMGEGTSSIVISGRTIEGGASGAVLAAADGVAIGSDTATLINTPAARALGDGLHVHRYQDPDIVLDESPAFSLAGLRASLASAPATSPPASGAVSPVVRPALALVDDAGALVALGHEGAALLANDARASELNGLRASFVSQDAIVLRRGDARLQITPAEKTVTLPEPAPLAIPAGADVVVAGVYSSPRVDNVVVVDVDRPGKDVVVALSAYDAVRWQVRPSKNTRIAAVIVGGYKAPLEVTGTTAPVVTRVHDYGEPYFASYDPKSPDAHMEVLTAATGGKSPVVVVGKESADHLQIGR